MLTDMMKDELVKGLLNLFHENLSMIILYGSVARNEATSESDIDIAIITKNDMNEEIRNKFQTVDKVLRETSVSRSIFLCVYEIYSENRKFSLGLCHP